MAMNNLRSLAPISFLLLGVGCSSESTDNTTSTSGGSGGQITQVGGAGAGGMAMSNSGSGGSMAGSASGGQPAGGAAGAAGMAQAGGGAGGAAGMTQGGGGAGGVAQGGGGMGGMGGMGGGAAGGGAGGMGGQESNVSFFVTSATSATGNLGGLAAADALCQSLADAAGYGAKTWHAYLSTSTENAGERIGMGPWYNVQGVMLAADLTELHALNGNYELFLDENGDYINGQWAGSPQPNEHDILTGTNRDGTVAEGLTCEDWTSDSDAIAAQVGHSDGLGPGGSMDAMYQPWNTTHESESCADTAPRGGAGKFYCFAID